MADRTGERFGNYRLIQLLGQGGFAEVYLGEHIHLNTQVAVKVLSAHLDAASVEQFQNEARIIAHFEHPHIIRVFDFGIENRIPYFVMSYAPGGTLRQKHPKGTRLPLATVVSYVNQIAPALQYAHFRKRIHRDIKPENMLLRADHKLVLSDFGISIAAHNLQSLTPQAISGTPYYMAPEQSQGQALPASDQYALGIMVYEWLTGARPFDGSSPIEIMMKHISHLPPSLQQAAPSLSADLEQVVMKALEKDPHKRFASVTAFAQALNQACQLAQPPRISSRKGALLQSFQIPEQITAYFSWMQDGPRLRFATQDPLKTIKAWDVTTGKSLFSLQAGNPHAYLSWSPRGRYLACVEWLEDEATTQLQLWEASLFEGAVHIVAWSQPRPVAARPPDGSGTRTGSLPSPVCRTVELASGSGWGRPQKKNCTSYLNAI